MTTLDLTQPIELDSGSYAFVARGGNNIRLRHELTGAILDTTMAELARAGVGTDLPPARSVRALESVSAKADERARQLAEHLREIETGVRDDGHGGEIRRPEYDVQTTTQEQRVKLKIEELRVHHGIVKSRATLMRDLKKFRAQGAAALIDGRALRHWGPMDNVDERVVQALTEVMVDQKNRSSGTRSRIIVEAKALLLRRYGADGPVVPSDSSLYRYIDSLDGGRQTTGLATSRRSRANRPDRTFADTTRLIPGEEVQIDAHTMDVLIRVPNGKPTRPYLTVMIDVATKSILSWTLRLNATKGIDHVVLLAGALVPPELRPDRSLHRELVHSRRPELPLRSAAELEQARRNRPYVFPRLLMMDNGRDFVSGVFESALAKFHIDMRKSAPHTPTDKGGVERTFRSTETLLGQFLAGYVGSSPDHRGYRVEDEKLLDFWSLYELLEDFFLFEWPNREHSGLRDRLDPSITYTPNQMIARAQELTSTLRIPMSPADYIDLMPIEWRVIGDTGVQLGNRHYDSDELHPLRRTRSKYPNKRGRWKVAYDPYNPTLVWVEGPDRNWIRCEARDLHLWTHPYEAELSPTAETERAAVARIGSELAGVPAHAAPVQPRPPRLTDFDDDFENLEPLPEFNPDEED